MKPEKNKITQVMESLDGINKATAPDFFYARLRARMERENSTVSTRPWILRPAFAVITLVVVFIINLAVIFLQPDATTISDTDSLQSLAAEYSLNDNSILDLSTDQ